MNTLPKSELVTIRITSQDVAQTDADSLDGILPIILEKVTCHPWRPVGANILVERVEPYRTFILHPPLLYQWSDHCNGCHETELAPFEFQAELYAPLSSTL